MHYYIDGYNLLFHLCHGHLKNITEERRAIIEEISAYVDELGLHATVVFDGTTQEGDLNRSHFSNLEVLFTEKGETADEWILDYVKHHRKPNQVMVVTSDKRLAWRARNFLAQTEDVAVFLKDIRKRSRKLKQPRRPKQFFDGLKKPEESVPRSPPPSIIDFYLESFTARYEQEAAEQEAAKPKQAAIKKPQVPPLSKKPPTTKRPYSEEEYRQIFEERMKGLDDGKDGPSPKDSY